MAQRYWSGTVDGTVLLDGADVAGFDLTGAHVFAMGSVVAASSPALSGVPLMMWVDLPVAGHIVELKFLHIPATLLATLLTKIIAHNAANTPFACSFQDGFQTIATNFKAAPGAWFERGAPDGAYIKDAIIRLISVGG